MGENHLDVFFMVEPSKRFPISSESRRDCKLVRFMTWSSIVHVAIGDGEAVLSADYRITAYYPQTSYERLPNIQHRIRIPTDEVVDLEGFYSKQIIPKSTVIAKWLTRGLIQTRDCVCTTKKILARADIHAPRSAWAPYGLYRWLKGQGYEEYPRRPAREKRRLNGVLRPSGNVGLRQTTADC